MSAIVIEDHTAAEWREQASASARRSAESWERSDTDGFLSQWAGDVMSSAYTYAAELLEAGGTCRELRLFDLDGNLLDARQVRGRYGYSWRIWNPDTRQVSWFNESRASDKAKRAAAHRAKGYQLGWVEGPAVLIPVGNGMSVRYSAVIRDGAPVTVVGPDPDIH